MICFAGYYWLSHREEKTSTDFSILSILVAFLVGYGCGDPISSLVSHFIAKGVYVELFPLKF